MGVLMGVLIGFLMGFSFTGFHWGFHGFTGLMDCWINGFKGEF